MRLRVPSLRFWCFLLRISHSKKIHQTEAVAQRCSVKKVFLEISQNSLENTCARVSFLIKLQACIKKETLPQVFSSEFCESSKNTFSCRTPPVAASYQTQVKSKF